MGVEGAQRLFDPAVGFGAPKDDPASRGLLRPEPHGCGPILKILRKDAPPVEGAFGKRLEPLGGAQHVRSLRRHAAVFRLQRLRRLACAQKRS